MQPMLRNKANNGFTVVEMLVVAPIVILFIGAFISAIVSMTGQVLISRASNSLMYNIQDALNRIEQDTKISNKLLATNDITGLTSPQGYNDDTTPFENASPTSGNAIILEQYAITNNPASNVRNLLYTNSPNACNSSLVTQNQPMKINVIYFVKNNTLWRRTILPSDYKTAGCDATTPTVSPVLPWQQPSCNPSQTGSICETNDIELVNGITNISDFSIDYFDSSDSTVENTAASDSSKSEADRGTAIQTANTIQVTINAKNTVAGRDISQSGTVRVTDSSNN